MIFPNELFYISLSIQIDIFKYNAYIHHIKYGTNKIPASLSILKNFTITILKIIISIKSIIQDTPYNLNIKKIIGHKKLIPNCIIYNKIAEELLFSVLSFI